MLSKKKTISRDEFTEAISDITNIIEQQKINVNLIYNQAVKELTEIVQQKAREIDNLKKQHERLFSHVFIEQQLTNDLLKQCWVRITEMTCDASRKERLINRCVGDIADLQCRNNYEDTYYLELESNLDKVKRRVERVEDVIEECKITSIVNCTEQVEDKKIELSSDTKLVEYKHQAELDEAEILYEEVQTILLHAMTNEIFIIDRPMFSFGSICVTLNGISYNKAIKIAKLMNLTRTYNYFFYNAGTYKLARTRYVEKNGRKAKNYQVHLYLKPKILYLHFGPVVKQMGLQRFNENHNDMGLKLSVFSGIIPSVVYLDLYKEITHGYNQIVQGNLTIEF